MKFSRKSPLPENDKMPLLPQAARDFVQAAKPTTDMFPLTELQKSQAPASDGSAPALPVGSSLHGLDRIVEIRIRQWLEDIKKTENTEKRGRTAGRALNFFPPRR